MSVNGVVIRQVEDGEYVERPQRDRALVRRAWERSRAPDAAGRLYNERYQLAAQLLGVKLSALNDRDSIRALNGEFALLACNWCQDGDLALPDLVAGSYIAAWDGDVLGGGRERFKDHSEELSDLCGLLAGASKSERTKRSLLSFAVCCLEVAREEQARVAIASNQRAAKKNEQERNLQEQKKRGENAAVIVVVLAALFTVVLLGSGLAAL